MNYKKMVVIIFLFGSLNLYAQPFRPKTMYVNAPDGLEMREEPSLNAAVVKGRLSHGEIIKLDSKSMNTVVIDGITDFWYRYKSLWVFGGYLSDVPAIIPLPIVLPKTMYVNAPDESYGIEKYAEPSINAAVTGKLLHGQEIVVNSKSMNPVIIDGIIDYWYRFESSWVFGGYLTVRLSSDIPAIFPTIMYVNASDGLNVRAEPSSDATVTGKLFHGHRIVIDSKSTTPVTIDGITNYWYRYKSSWVFGGYLSDHLPSDVPVFLGDWEKGNSGGHYIFEPNNYFVQGAEESEYYNSCKWELNGNTLTLTQLYEGGFADYIPAVNPEITQIHLSVINRDYIILTYPDGRQIKLIRCNRVI